MLSLLSRNWWTFAIRGLVAVLFGVAAFVWPNETWQALVVVFGAYILLDGILTLTTTLGSPFVVEGRGWLTWRGILGMIVGIVTPLYLHASLVVLVYLVGAWAIVTGVIEIAVAVHLRDEIEHAGRFALAGILGVVVGALLFWQPSAGQVALARSVGALVIVYGIVQLVIAYRLQDLDDQITKRFGEAY